MTDQAVLDRMAHARAARSIAKDQEKQAAAEKAPLADPDKLPPGFVRVRVLRFGDGKIATGRMDTISRDDKFPKHKFGDILALPRDVAEAQENNGFVEILPDAMKAL